MREGSNPLPNPLPNVLPKRGRRISPPTHPVKHTHNQMADANAQPMEVVKEKQKWERRNLGCLCPCEKKLKAGSKRKQTAPNERRLLPCGKKFDTAENVEALACDKAGHRQKVSQLDPTLHRQLVSLAKKGVKDIKLGKMLYLYLQKPATAVVEVSEWLVVVFCLNACYNLAMPFTFCPPYSPPCPQMTDYKLKLEKVQALAAEMGAVGKELGVDKALVNLRDASVRTTAELEATIRAQFGEELEDSDDDFTDCEGEEAGEGAGEPSHPPSSIGIPIPDAIADMMARMDLGAAVRAAARAAAAGQPSGSGSKSLP